MEENGAGKLKNAVEGIMSMDQLGIGNTVIMNYEYTNTKSKLEKRLPEVIQAW